MFNIFGSKWKNKTRQAKMEYLSELEEEDKLVEIFAEDDDKDIRRHIARKIKSRENIISLLEITSDIKTENILIDNISTQEDALHILLKTTGISRALRISDKINSDKLLADAAKKHPSEEIRILIVKKIEDENELAAVLIFNSDNQISIKASEMIKDPKISKDLFESSKNVTIKQNLLKNITDQFFLKRIIESKGEHYHKTAIKNISDPAYLHELAINSGNQKKRKLAIMTTDNEATLFMSAKREKNKSIRLKAVERISNQEHLQYVALHDPLPLIRSEAVSRIESREFLVTIIQSDESNNVRKEAFNRINSEIFLKTLVNTSSDRFMIKKSISGINDQTFLKNFIEGDADKFLKAAAVKKITDQNYLKKLVSDRSLSRYIRAAAASLITDTIETEVIIENDETFIAASAVLALKGDPKAEKIIADSNLGLTIRKAAARLVDDDFKKADIAVKSENLPFAFYTSRRITDKNALKYIYDNTENGELKNFVYERMPAVMKKKLEDEALFRKLKETDKKNKVHTVNRIVSQELLIKIYTDCSDSIIRMIALKRINDQEFINTLLKDNNIPPSVKVIALLQAEDQEMIEYSIKNSENTKVMKIAIRKSKNTELLQELISDTDMPSEIIAEAELRLTQITGENKK